MKIIWYSLVSSVIVLFSFRTEEQSTCDKIRNGKFYYFSKRTRERINIFRQDSLQIEQSEMEKENPQKNKIVWKADCEFDLYINGMSDKNLTGMDSLIAVTPANVKIIYVGTTYYVCTVHLKILDNDFRLRDTMYYSGL